ncbi:MAG: hypothetical protein CMO80_20270 [Verrucomicrobiales bacterium]|nr:hypothetical protein [Verrucomicrobiales bacterium]|tara:strand:- start:2564 stop:2944 length:381 start_codon:yes stop_codon:yes gene_type:complete
MEDLFIRFSEPLPATTGLMLLVYLLARRKLPASYRHLAIVAGLILLACMPLFTGYLPKWRVLPRFTELSSSSQIQWFFWLGILWLSGVLLFLIRFAAGAATLHWTRKTVFPADERLWQITSAYLCQ